MKLNKIKKKLSSGLPTILINIIILLSLLLMTIAVDYSREQTTPPRKVRIK